MPLTFLPFTSSAFTFKSSIFLLPSLYIQSCYLDRELPIDLTRRNSIRNKRNTNLFQAYSATKYTITMDDWQDAAFSSRHMHNRVNRNGGRGGGKSKRTAFDVRKTFGSYECKCPAWHRINSEGGSSDQHAVLELYRLTENGQGVVGELSLPGVLQAAVILAASRKSLQGILSELEPVNPQQEDEKPSESANTTDETGDWNQDEDSDEEESEQEPEPDRFETFEKNSFREPKFWLQWNGMLSPTSGEPEKAELGLGYIIFPSNDCKKFKGTLNCASLEWKDVALSGHKIAPRSESDIPVAWGPDGVSV